MIEEERLASLRDLRILDTGSDEAFDRLTQLVVGALGVPIAAITLVDEDRVWRKSHFGLGVKETRREGSFCTHVVERADVFVVEDVSLDLRFAASMLYRQHGVRFYAGAPITLATGAVVGAVCALDVKPRRPAASSLASLRGLATAAGHLLDLRRERSARCDTDHLLREHARLFGSVEELAEVGLWRLDFTTGVVQLSPAAKEIHGIAEEQATPVVETLLAMYDPADRSRLVALIDEARRMGRGYSFDGRLRRGADGAGYAVRLKTSVECDCDGRPVGLIGVIRDVTVEKKVINLLNDKRAKADRRVRRMTRLASTDALTTLLNRRAFLERAERALSDGTAKAVAILDLDHFKTINDRFGHDAGDVALNAFGRMCNAVSDRHCTVGRIGGEEFAFLLMGPDEAVLTRRIDELRAITAARAVATRDGLTMHLTFSAGVATVQPGDDWKSLFQRSDRALYRAKKEGRDRTAIAA